MKTQDSMTPKQVAIFFNRSLHSIKNWTKKGYLKKYGIGKSGFYRRSELMVFAIPLKKKALGIMSLEDVSLFLKRHKVTIDYWEKKSVLEKHGIGRAVYYKRSEVESVLENINRNVKK